MSATPTGGAEPVPSDFAKLIRLSSMVKQLLDEIHGMSLDLRSRERLVAIYDRAVSDVARSPDEHGWAGRRQWRCTSLAACEGRVGPFVCDDNLTMDDVVPGDRLVGGPGGCAR